MKKLLLVVLILGAYLLAIDPPPGPDVPEPASILLLGAGASAMAFFKNRKK